MIDTETILCALVVYFVCIGFYFVCLASYYKYKWLRNIK